MEIQQLLFNAIKEKASDLHLTVGTPPIVRINGTLQALDYPALTSRDTTQLIYGILNDEQKRIFEEKWELDFSVDIASLGRVRVNVHKQRGSVEAAFRIVNENIRSISELGLPPVVEELSRRDMGLILVTGPTGSGKTSTLAAMISQINDERNCVVITIEDPIEYIHRNKRSIIKQREINSDTHSFSDALRHVLRQDPDVICIGEMRDLETISTALTAAETGHLVLATIHTPDAVQTVDRIIDVFPPHQQTQVRFQFSNTLQGIVAQQLLPTPGSFGRIVATEILICTLAVRKVIRSAKTEQLYTIIQTGQEQSMTTMDKSLKILYQQGLITYETALSKCKFPESFEAI